MKPRLYPFAALLIAMLIATALRAADAPPKKMNVLFIISDDLNNHIGCYGDKIVQTPNLDRLASMGIRFDHAYCQYPVCNPSRSSFLSGLYPDTSKVFDQQTLLRAQRVPSAVYLPEHFKNNGYFIAGIGKVEHMGHHEIKWDASDDFHGAGGADDEGDVPTTRPRRNRAAAATQRANRTPTKRREVLPYEVKRETEENDPENVDDAIAAKTIKLLEEHKDGPFFVAAGFHKPHVPHVAPKKYFDLYPIDEMPLTFVPEGDEKDIPPAAIAAQKNYQPDMSPEQQRDIISAYYACTSYFDAKVGQVMEAMDRLKLWDNTIVVLIGDHGWGFGEHHWWAKASLFEPSARAPLIIVAPGVKPAACERIVQFLDIYPTLADFCQLPPPPQSQGRSIVPLLKDPSQSWEEVALTALQTRGRTIRTEQYRYTEWQNGKAGVELYDHDADPNEFTNLAKDPDHADVVDKMHKLLRATIPTTQPS